MEILFINIGVDLELKLFRLKAFLKSFRNQINYTLAIQMGRHKVLFGECLSCSGD